MFRTLNELLYLTRDGLCDLADTITALLPTVRRFFSEDLPRVIQLGDNNWQSLDWHVGPKCSACDWLGYGRWLGTADQQRVGSHRARGR
jgi:hypothetical protein